VEVGGNIHTLNSGYPNWSGEYLKGEYKSDTDNVWNAMLLNQRQFGSTGYYGSVGNTHVIDEDWFTNLSVGGSTSGVFLPTYRVDGFINRKWLDRRQLITTLGMGYYKSRDSYTDNSLFVGATYYFESPWILQGGVRFNRSTPGRVYSMSEFIALTHGREGERLLTGRYGFGKEAYQVIGPGNVLSEFHSHTASLQWRQWVEENWGFDLLGETYFSRNYDRKGINGGVFLEF